MMSLGAKAVYFTKMLVALGYNSVSKILPVFLASTGMAPSAIGAVNSSYQIARGAGAAFMGYAGDRLGRKNSLYLALGITALLALSLVMAKSTLDFSAVFFGIGIAATLTYFSLDAIATSGTKEKAGELSKMEAFYQAGFLFGPLIGGWLAFAYGMVAVYAFWALTSLAAIAAVHSIKFRAAGTPSGLLETADNLLHSARQKPSAFLLFLAVGGLFIGFAEGARDILVALYAFELGFDTFFVGGVFGAAAAITMVGIWLLGKKIDAHGSAAGLAAGTLVVAASFAALPYATSFWVMAAIVGILSLGRTFGYVSTRAFASDALDEAHRTSGYSLFDIFFSAGRTIGALAGGIMFGNYGSSMSFWICFGVSVAALALSVLYLVFNMQKKSE